jgi:hypothetical protein
MLLLDVHLVELIKRMVLKGLFDKYHNNNVSFFDLFCFVARWVAQCVEQRQVWAKRAPTTTIAKPTMMTMMYDKSMLILEDFDVTNARSKG